MLTPMPNVIRKRISCRLPRILSFGLPLRGVGAHQDAHCFEEVVAVFQWQTGDLDFPCLEKVPQLGAK